MRYFKPVIKTFFLLYAGYLLSYLAFQYAGDVQRVQPPLVIWLGDAVTLIIHEAGHFFFAIFGRVLYLMGGSIFQVLFPVGITVWVFLYYREYSFIPALWVAHSMCNAAVYIGDAPYKRLQLIAKGLIHDWNDVFTRLNMMEYAGTVAGMVHWGGVLLGLLALSFGVYTVIDDYRFAYDIE